MEYGEMFGRISRFGFQIQPAVRFIFPAKKARSHSFYDKYYWWAPLAHCRKMGQSLTRITNPIYDGVFKYLLDDNRVA